MVQLHWQGNTPISLDYDDVYYSLHGGLKEARHVFIQGNRLLERWQSPTAVNPFTICELGFGTGLNFCAVYEAFCKHAPKEAYSLRYISCEKAPLNLEQLQNALSPFTELESYYQEFLRCYAQKYVEITQSSLAETKSMQYLSFYGGRIQLHLYFSSAATMCQDLSQTPGMAVDAWFLDGFAPTKNPDMWTKEIFKQMAQLSQGYVSCATYSVAACVCQGLSEVGFAVKRLPGFANKRHMLVGEWT